MRPGHVPGPLAPGCAQLGCELVRTDDCPSDVCDKGCAMVRGLPLDGPIPARASSSTRPPSLVQPEVRPPVFDDLEGHAPPTEPGLCECGHPIARHHSAPRCTCGHLRLAHYGTTKDGKTYLAAGCGLVECTCIAYQESGPPVVSYCLATHHCLCNRATKNPTMES